MSDSSSRAEAGQMRPRAVHTGFKVRDTSQNKYLVQTLYYHGNRSARAHLAPNTNPS